MLAILKADFRRLLHSKGFWTMEIILLTLPYVINFQPAQDTDIIQTFNIDGLAVLKQAFESGASIQTFMLLMTLYLIGPELSRQIYKNSLISGVSRLKYYLNKWLMIFLLTGFNLLIFVGLRYLYARCFLDMSGVTNEFLVQGFQVVILQWIFIQFWVSIFFTIMHLSHSIPITLTSFFLVGPLMTYIPMLWPNITWLRYIDVDPNFQFLQDPNLPLALGLTLTKTLLIGCLGYQIFKRRDL